MSLFGYIKIYRKYIGNKVYLVFIMVAFSALLESLGIMLFAPLFQSLSSSGQEAASIDTSTIPILPSLLDSLGVDDSIELVIGLIILLFFIKSGLMFSAQTLVAFHNSMLLKNLRKRLYDSYINAQYSFLLGRDMGFFVSVFNEQSNRAVGAFNNLMKACMNSMSAMFYVGFAFYNSPSMGAAIVGVSVFLAVGFRALNRKVRALSINSVNESASLAKWYVQSINANYYLKATSQFRVLEKIVSSASERFRLLQFRTNRLAALTQALREPIAITLFVLVLFVHVSVYDYAFESLIVSGILLYRGFNAAYAVQSSWQASMETIGSIEAVDSSVEEMKANAEVSGSSKPNFEKGSDISIENLSYRYADNLPMSLDSIDFNIQHGTTVALVGTSGSGKTTLINLLSLLYKPNNGCIRVNGQSLEEVSTDYWRSRIGFVAQNAEIFDGSILDNISMFSKDSDLSDRIIAAAKMAYIHDFIISLPDGYDTLVGEKGARLSGGQKQRLFLARELFKSPDILILDEATSALDYESEKYIQKSIDSMKGSMTVIIIAHRLNTIKNADQIYVLSKGKLIESGTYQELEGDNESAFYAMINQ